MKTQSFFEPQSATTLRQPPTSTHFASKAPNIKHSATRNGFTLIELLTVIAVITLLAAIMMPALKGARDSVKKAKTAALINGLGIALKSYYNEYGFWPNTSAPQTADTELTAQQNERLFQMLSGSDVWLDPGTTGGNPRRIVFLEIKNSDLGTVNTTPMPSSLALLKDPTSTTTNLVNPWGNGFHVMFDYNGDNTVNPFGTVSVVTGFTIWVVGLSGNTYTNMSWK